MAFPSPFLRHVMQRIWDSSWYLTKSNSSDRRHHGLVQGYACLHQPYLQNAEPSSLHTPRFCYGQPHLKNCVQIWAIYFINDKRESVRGLRSVYCIVLPLRLLYYMLCIVLVLIARKCKHLLPTHWLPSRLFHMTCLAPFQNAFTAIAEPTSLILAKFSIHLKISNLITRSANELILEKAKLHQKFRLGSRPCF